MGHDPCFNSPSDPHVPFEDIRAGGLVHTADAIIKHEDDVAGVGQVVFCLLPLPPSSTL